MKATRATRGHPLSTAGMAAVLACTGLTFNMALAQDSAFIACGQYSDRGQRIACLEDALEAATAAASATPAQPAQPATPNTAVVVTPSGPAPATATSTAPATAPAPVTAPTPAMPPAAVTAPTPATVTADEPASPATASTPENDPSLLDRLRNFGKRETASVSTGEDGREQLNDTITKLEKRNDLWIVTLSSGQVWRQEFPRMLNLREGDEISIYQAGMGDGYRLATKRLSGFIRVERLQ